MALPIHMTASTAEMAFDPSAKSMAVLYSEAAVPLVDETISEEKPASIVSISIVAGAPEDIQAIKYNRETY